VEETQRQPGWHGYVMAFLIGVVLIPLSLLLDPRDTHLAVSLSWSVILYFVFAAVAGGMVPGGTWRVGFFVSAPLVAFVGTSVYLVTGRSVYFGRDVPMILASVAAAEAGGWLGSWLAPAAKRDRRA
jgi:hypothetical protein